MSALGNYIHSNQYDNYKKYGIVRQNEGDHKKLYSPIDVEDFLENRLSRAGITTNDSQLETAAAELKRRMQRNTSDNLLKDNATLDQDFQAKLDKMYEIIMKRTDEGISKGLIYGTDATFGYSGNKDALHSMGLERKVIEEKKSKLEKLNQKVDELTKEGFVQKSKIQKLVTEFESITNSVINEKEKTDLGKLQQALLEYNFNTWVSMLYGDFGENYVALCSDAIKQATEDKIEEILNQIVIGNQRSESKFDKSSISVKLPKETINKKEKRTIRYKNDSGEYSLGYSQNKVDVDMKVDGVEILANVKDYFNSNKVTLQSQVNLLSSLIYLNNTCEDTYDFGNHWLNMHAGQLKGTGRANADRLLEKEIAFEALVSGNPLKDSQNANVFVYMERQTGIVIVKPVSEILLKNFGLFSISPKTSNIVFGNKWQGAEGNSSFDASARISKLLAEAHQRRFKVILRLDDLKEKKLT